MNCKKCKWANVSSGDTVLLMDNGMVISQHGKNNDRIISAMSRQELEQLLSKVQEEVQAQNKNVVFVDCSSGIIYEARVVTYIGNVPEIMRNYKHKFIQKEDGKWYRESLLGKCCVCGEYKELGVSTSKGKMCFECWARREI